MFLSKILFIKTKVYALIAFVAKGTLKMQQKLNTI